MALAGNQGTTQAADKAVAKAKKLKKKPVATGSRGDSGSGLSKPTPAPKPPGPPNFPKQIPVRPGARTNRFTSKPTTQAQRTHVHKERIKRNKELAPAKAYVSTGKAVEALANKANASERAAAGVKGDLAKQYAKKHPELFNAQSKAELKTAGLSPDIGVKLSTNAYKDLISIGETPVSTYHLAEPTVSALAQGKVEKAAHEAVRAGKQVGQQYVDIAKHPVKSFVEHPVLTPLALSGPKAIVGRGAGAALRAGALGKAGRAVADTAPYTEGVAGTSLKTATKHKYSPDLLTKAAQVTVEKGRAAHERTLVHYGKVPKAKRPVGKMSNGEIHTRMDERIAANEDRRRLHRGDTIHEAHTAITGSGRISESDALAQYARAHMGAKLDTKGRLVVSMKHASKGTKEYEKLTKIHALRERGATPGEQSAANARYEKVYAKSVNTHRLLGDAEIRAHATAAGVKIKASKGTAAEHVTSLVAQGIVRSDRADVQAYIHELEAEHPKLDPVDKARNASLRKNLQDAIDDPKYSPAAVDRAARAYKKVIEKRQPALIEHGVLNTEQATRAKMIPYAIRRMGAAFDSKVGGIAKDGNLITTDAMVKHFQKNNPGEDLPAYVTHRGSGRGSFNVRSERAQGLGPGHRTGEATRKGLFDTSHQHLIANAARVQGLHDAVQGFGGIIKEVAVKHPDRPNEIQTWSSQAAATKAGRNMRYDAQGNFLDHTHEMVPIRIQPFKGAQSQLEDLVQRTAGDEMYGKDSPIRDSIEGALKGDEGPGQWTLIPKAAQNRLMEHLGTMGSTTFEQGASALSNVFRKTVLTTSPTWIWGNTAEAGLRSAIYRVRPGDRAYANKVLNRLKEENPDLYEEVMARVVGGGHLSTAHRMQIVRTSEQFADSKLEGLANALHAVHEAPGPKQVAHGWSAYTDHVLHYNSKLESAFQKGLFGRSLRKQGMGAIDDAVRGLHHTENQVQFGRMVDEAYGKYSKWSPSTRRLISNYTPFISWWMNAVKFVGYTLPKDHPVLTSLLATAQLATREWRQKEKVDLEHLLGSSGEFLAGSVPLKGGKHVGIARYTPFGAFTNPTSIPDLVLPQVSSFRVLFTGQNWKNQKAKNRLAEFGTEMAGAYIPFFQREQSAKKYGALQSVNPYRAVAPGKKGTKGSKAKRAKKLDILGHGSGAKIDILGGATGRSGGTKIDILK